MTDNDIDIDIDIDITTTTKSSVLVHTSRVCVLLYCVHQNVCIRRKTIVPLRNTYLLTFLCGWCSYLHFRDICLCLHERRDFNVT